jgi:hypothetical protein
MSAHDESERDYGMRSATVAERVDVAEPDGEVQRALHRQRELLDTLESLAASLQDRLGPVLQLQPPRPEDPGKLLTDASLSPLTVEVADANHRIVASSDRLRNVLDRLAV